MSTTGSVKRVTIEGLVTLTMNDGMEVQTTRRIDIELDVNGAGSSQVVSHLRVETLIDEAEPYGMVDSDDPMVWQFVNRFMEIIAAPGMTLPANDHNGRCFDVPARPAAHVAD